MVGFLILWAALLDIGFGLGPFLQPESGGSSVHRFWELERLWRLDHVGLCTNEWRDFKGSIYFDDGALTHGEIPQTTAVDISECFSEGEDLIHSCHFLCSLYFNAPLPPPSWTCLIHALIRNRAPGLSLQASTRFHCDLNFLSVAAEGFVEQLMPAMTWNRESMDMFHDVLQEAAKRFAGNLTAQSPLLPLANPK